MSEKPIVTATELWRPTQVTVYLPHGDTFWVDADGEACIEYYAIHRAAKELGCDPEVLACEWDAGELMIRPDPRIITSSEGLGIQWAWLGMHLLVDSGDGWSEVMSTDVLAELQDDIERWAEITRTEWTREMQADWDTFARAVRRAVALREDAS